MLIIIKPSDKKNNKKQLKWLLDECRQRDLNYQLLLTTGDFQADCDAIKKAATEFKKVVAVGGDGTLHLVVNALFAMPCVLALLPCGTGNDFARGFGCDQQAWYQSIFSSEPRYIDIGQINERYFINVAGIGFDAEVVNSLAKQASRTVFSYRWQAIKQLWRFSAQPLTGVFAKQHKQYANLMTVFANHSYFGGGLCIAPHAELADGLLECYQIPSSGLLTELYSFIQLLAVNHHRLTTLNYQQLSSALISTPNLLIEADGELVGRTPATVSIHHHALLFCCPEK
ncbi:diacylglycerol/lipid kinase family protein [Pseudoalteromonas mariniglutinosa]|uniref:diacylglycerol/lipid kinase family protein n=1 Tax=Pseudoalteromonas mariniglutinosa TaxID=206042 RepID=UPI00384B7AAD